MTGARYEREFANLFRSGGWHAQRAAASGAATAADLPDVTFARDGHAFAADLETSDSSRVYLDPDETGALGAYARAYGMEPVVGVRIKGIRAWGLYAPRSMPTTDAGRYIAEDGEEAIPIALDGSDGGLPIAELSPTRLSNNLQAAIRDYRVGAHLMERDADD